MKCEYCDNVSEIEGDDIIVAVDMYKIGGNVVFCCSDCLEDHLPKDDRVPFRLPDGWSVIDDLKLKEYDDQHRAIINVNIEMEKAEGVAHSDRYYPHPAGRLKDMLDGLNSRIERHVKFRESVGLSGDLMGDMISGAYCPRCRSPLINTNQHVTSQIISDIVAGGKRKLSEIKDFGKRKQAFVCLGCLTTYIEDRDYE